VAGTRLRDVAPKVGTDDDPENWAQVHKDVINGCVCLTSHRQRHENVTETRELIGY